MIDRLFFRQFFDHQSSTYTYLLADSETRHAVLIDPVYEQFQRDSSFISELELILDYTLETHVHADHVTSAWLMRKRFGGRIVVSKHGGTTGHNRLVDDGDAIEFGGLRLDVMATPGHTNGCVTYVLGDKTMAFTGDALLIRGAGRTDFQQGNPHTLFHSITKKIYQLPHDIRVHPAHDYHGRTVSTVGEELLYNPRIHIMSSEEDFVGYMNNLGLPHPKQMDVAVPANLACGKPSADMPAPREPDWAPVVRSFAGVPELDIHWVAEHRRDVRLIDVREPSEFSGELGHVPGAELVPLGSLESTTAGWDRETPLVLVCRSGGRSARAAGILEKAGFTQVANLRGGMIRWHAAGLPTG